MFGLRQRLAEAGSFWQTLAGTSVTMTITAIGAVVSFLMFSISARWLGPEEFGLFSVWFSAASFLAVLAGAGQETLIVRTWAEYTTNKHYGLARGALQFGLGITVAGGLLMAIAVAAGSVALGFDTALILAACFFIVTQTMMHFGTNASHNIVGYVVGQGSADVTWRLLVLLALVLPILPDHWHTAATVLMVAAAAQLLMVGVQLGSVYWRVAPMVRDVPAEVRPKEWRGRGVRMWAAAIVEASGQYLDVVIVSLLIDPVTAGAYFAATRVANLFARVSSAMASYARRRVAPLHFSGKRAEVVALSRAIAIVTLVVVAAGFLVILLFGRLLLSMFGESFTAQMPTLIILSIGAAAMALSGSASIFLQQTGHEGLYARIIAIGFVGRALLMLALTPLYGTQGAALAWTIASIVMAIVVTSACRRAVGVDPSPFVLLSAPGKGPHPRAVHADKREKPKRIVMVQTQAEAAGAQEISRLVGDGLTARGYEVHHVFFFRRTQTLDFLPNTHYCADERPSGPIGLLSLCGKLWRHLVELRPSAILTFQHYGNMIAAPVARSAGIRQVIATRTTSATQLSFLVEFLDVIMGMMPVYSKIVVNSRKTESEIARYPAIYRRKVVRIDHGFGTKTSSLDKGDAREAFGLPKWVPMLGCVARLHPQKNQAAAIKLLATEPRWHLALAGQGADRPELERLATQLGCLDRIHFIGEITPHQIGDFLATLDVFVFPSLAESFGLAPVEAAQAGIPVVANELPVLREVLAVNGSPCALFVDVDNAEQFAAAVSTVLRGGPDVRTMVDRGRKLSEKYSLDAMIEGYVQLLGNADTKPAPNRNTSAEAPAARSEQV